MIYLFEDKKDDILSKLFRAGYTNTSNFIYANGNSKLEKTACNILQTTSENVGIFIDMIPGNDSIHKIYYSLKRLGNKYPNRVIILPLVCSEYYFIRSILDTNIIRLNRDVTLCTSRGLYFGADALNDPRSKVFCKNFEKFCKLILMRYVDDCVRHSTIKEDGSANSLYGYYYTNNCHCNKSKTCCKSISLEDKSFKFLSEFPCIPVGSNSKCKVNVSDQEMIQLRLKLINDYNKMVDLYKGNDPDKTKKYKYIT